MVIVFSVRLWLTVSDYPIGSFKLFVTIINTIMITLILFIFTLRRQHDTYITVTVPIQTYDKCVTENRTHLPLPCRDKMNMSVCGDVLLIIHVTLSDGSSTLNAARLVLMLMGLILNVSGRPCIIGACNDNDHMSSTLWFGDLWHDL
jgi:hypothetical protein